MKATVAIASADHIGEAPLWDDRAKRLLWVDHAVGVIHEARALGESWRETRRWELKRPVAAAIPRAREGLVVAGERDIFLLEESGETTPVARLDVEASEFRINEAKCDAAGCLWFGTLSWTFEPLAALYRLSPEGCIETKLTGIALANGFDWSPDGSSLYFIDTLRMQIEAYSMAALGSGPKVIVRFEAGAGGGNGLTVDAEGCLWVALTGGGEIRRYSPEGDLLQRVSISVPGATSCAFGGPNLADLFITSRSGRMPDIARSVGVKEDQMESKGIDAGALFICRPGVKGRPCHAFRA